MAEQKCTTCGRNIYGRNCPYCETDKANNITVKKQGRQWGIYRNDELLEGGFFDRQYAQRAAIEWRGGIR